jgi:hypothetical protein
LVRRSLENPGIRIRSQVRLLMLSRSQMRVRVLMLSRSQMRMRVLMLSRLLFSVVQR